MTSKHHRAPAIQPPELTDAEFAALLLPLGPFGTERRVAVAVSGGPDSMALAYLLGRWGDPLAIIVDHGLRPDSAAEAALVAHRLRACAIPALILRAHLTPGPAAAERARHARYDLLLQACRDSGRPDLFLGHHRADQAETVLMREQAGSAPAGLAAMPARTYRAEARLLRPFLAIPPGRLRATLLRAGIDWVDDPTNRDTRTLRARLRAGMDPAMRDHLAIAAHDSGHARAVNERALAEELATIRIHPEGYALVPADLSSAALASIVWTISGQRYPPPRAALESGLAARTIHGVLLRPTGRTALIAREPAAVAGPAHARPGLLWDGRFRLLAAPPALTIAALGADASGVRRWSDLPATVLRTLPALRNDGKLVAVPHLDFPDAETCRSVTIVFAPAHPIAGAVFTTAPLTSP